MLEQKLFLILTEEISCDCYIFNQRFNKRNICRKLDRSEALMITYSKIMWLNMESEGGQMTTYAKGTFISHVSWLKGLSG